MDVIINVIGFAACAILIYAWAESKFKGGSKRKSMGSSEKLLKARRDLFTAIKKKQS